jgi:hypothetical protein
MRSSRKFPRWVKPELEHLESREAPSVTPWTTLSFDGVTAADPPSSPTLPPNWSQWNSDGYTTFSVTNSTITPPPQRLERLLRNERLKRREPRRFAGLVQ